MGKMKCRLPPAFKNMEKDLTSVELCLEPSTRYPHDDSEKPSAGTCVQPPEISVEDVDYSKFINRELCEKPESRLSLKEKAQKKKQEKIKRKKKIENVDDNCECRKPDKKLKCDFGQFKSKEECTDPGSREKVNLHEGPNKVQCWKNILTGYNKYPEGKAFDCSHFKTKASCEKPEMRSFLFFVEEGEVNGLKNYISPAPYFTTNAKKLGRDLYPPTKDAYVN